MAGTPERSRLDHVASRVARSITRSALAVLLGLGPGVAWAGDGTLTGVEGHRIQRFPLRVWAQPFDADVTGALLQAMEDWNAVFREALDTSVDAFVRAETRPAADVLISNVAPGRVFDPSVVLTAEPLGSTSIASNEAGVIRLPVTIYVRDSAAPGSANRRTLFYHVLGHELGHALGLPHAPDPRSIMCCQRETLRDAAAHAAFMLAVRRPDVRSARGQLAEHYSRFWSSRPR